MVRIFHKLPHIFIEELLETLSSQNILHNAQVLWNKHVILDDALMCREKTKWNKKLINPAKTKVEFYVNSEITTPTDEKECIFCLNEIILFNNTWFFLFFSKTRHGMQLPMDVLDEGKHENHFDLLHVVLSCFYENKRFFVCIESCY